MRSNIQVSKKLIQDAICEEIKIYYHVRMRVEVRVFVSGFIYIIVITSTKDCEALKSKENLFKTFS